MSHCVLQIRFNLKKVYYQTLGQLPKSTMKLHWCSEEMKSFLGHRQIFLNFRNCQSYQVVDDKIQSSVLDNLCCPSQEADTKIIFHACNISDQSNIVIRASDIDILIIMIGNMKQLQNSKSHIWMLNGTGNNERYIDVTKIHDELGELLAKSLIGFHAFTGWLSLMKERKDLLLC